MRPLLTVMAALTLAAAACGDSDTGSDADPPVPTSSSVAAPTDAESVSETESGDPPPPLAATDTGITADTIKIAAVYPDVSIIGNDSGDVEAKFRAVVDTINRAGGVNARMIEMLVDLPVSSSTNGSASRCRCCCPKAPIVPPRSSPRSTA